jgi:thiol:disulfide interchange protein DsbC
MHQKLVKYTQSICLSLVVMATQVWAQSHAELETSLLRISPDLKAISIEATPMAGIYDVQLSTGDRIYMSADGEFFFAGTMYQNSPGERLVNLTELGAVKTRQLAMQSSAAQESWVFSAVGEKKASISVFTDVDCFYCQKLHREMVAINELGIEVKYLAFPRAGIGSSSYQVLVDAWCADNPNEFLTEAKARSHNKQAPQASPALCNNPVAAHYKLGQQIGVNGTPAIILDSGELWPGYIPAQELAKRLGVL